MSGTLKIALVALACSALVLQPAAAYSFNFGGGYGSGIYNSASYYQSHGLSQQSYRSDLSNALHSSSASAAAASSGFASAMAQALEGSDYRTYGYSCAGAIGYGSTGSWTSAFGQAKSHGFGSSGAAAAAAATAGGEYGSDVASATAAAASSNFGSSAAAAAASSGRRMLAEPIMV
ncbi:hypothetical protein WJX79_005159 [Trebouxia sp. C0005]